ncbi:MAG TPA: DUF1294 domain-containing protein [Anaerolineaceae bacterium]|nr:DUF1294 domain-containing protein [Anaerolineaceae bacterium]
MNETVLLFAIPLTSINFLLFGYDKFQAKRNGWRIPERVLLGLTILGGGVGGLAGMLVFRHKTRKNVFWLAAIVGIGLLIYLTAFWRG